LWCSQAEDKCVQCVLRFAASSAAGTICKRQTDELYSCAAQLFGADGNLKVGDPQTVNLGRREAYQTAVFEGLILGLCMALDNGFQEVQVETHDQILANQVTLCTMRKAITVMNYDENVSRHAATLGMRHLLPCIPHVLLQQCRSCADVWQSNSALRAHVALLANSQSPSPALCGLWR
jgi:hypothetical protein